MNCHPKENFVISSCKIINSGKSAKNTLDLQWDKIIERAAFTGQPTPVCATPLSQVHTFTTKEQGANGTMQMRTFKQIRTHAQIPTRTGTRASSVVQFKPGVTRRALHGTVRGASSPRCSHAIVTRTTISYKSEQHMSVRSQCACIGFDTQ